MSSAVFRTGLTTGACAQAAARACARMLTTGEVISNIDIELPNGESRNVSLVNQEVNKDCAVCGVIKDSGEEEKDVTNGILVLCKINERPEPGIVLVGGKGVGKVTRHGLAVPVGEYAINPVPRQMILRDVRFVLPQDKGFIVEISVPEGERIAQKTYNPRLGVKGGISIIGTTGLVKPKSHESYKKSLEVEINVSKAAGYSIIFIASGYLGEKLLTSKFSIPEQQIIKAGDHIGFMLDKAVEKGFKKAMLIGHIGKLAKVAAGLFNTHSNTGDARLETIAAYAAAAGAGQNLVKQILKLNLAEVAVDLLKENNFMFVFNDIARKVAERSNNFCKGKLEISAVILSLKGEAIGSFPKNIFEREIWEKFIS